MTISKVGRPSISESDVPPHIEEALLHKARGKTWVDSATAVGLKKYQTLKEWVNENEVARQFYLNDDSAELNAIGGAGRIITLKLSRPSTAKKLSYIRGGKWRQEEAIIWGSDGAHLFRVVEEAVAVQPDKRLSEAADGAGWEVLLDRMTAPGAQDRQNLRR